MFLTSEFDFIYFLSENQFKIKKLNKRYASTPRHLAFSEDSLGEEAEILCETEQEVIIWRRQ
jgi:hypothetical protein